jgi:hypothetical protein
VIIWLNGAFGAGKTTLSGRLEELVPDALVFDPEEIGFAVRNLVPPSPTGDFQDLPLWRSLTVHALKDVRRLYRRPLIVPMTLVNPAYVTEIHGALAEAGEHLVHVFLDVDRDVLRARITAQVLMPHDAARDQEAREWRLAQVDRCSAARELMPASTHVLDAGALDPEELAAKVLEIAGVRV